VPLYGQPMYGQPLPPGYPLYAPGMPPGYPTPASPPARKSRMGLIIGIVAAALVAVLVTSVGVALALTSGRIASLAGEAPTTLPTPTLVESPVFDDPLTSPQHPWPVSDHCFFAADGYHIKDSRICFAPTGVFGDQSIRVRVKQISGSSDHGVGVVFRVRDRAAENRYTFLVFSDGTWNFYKFVNGTRTDIEDNTDPAINGLNQVNELKIVARGDDFQFFANGKKLGETHDSTFDLGEVGLDVGQGNEAVFSDLHIAIVG
jgi:hypothetical protein